MRRVLRLDQCVHLVLFKDFDSKQAHIDTLSDKISETQHRQTKSDCAAEPAGCRERSGPFGPSAPITISRVIVTRCA